MLLRAARSLARASRTAPRAPRALSTAAAADLAEPEAPQLPAGFDSLSDEHAALLAFPFGMGCQDKKQASDYEKALAALKDRRLGF